jgi:hypothetical protein
LGAQAELEAMWPSKSVRRQLTAVGIGLYLVWAVAVVLLVGTQLGVLPRLPPVEETVVAGAVVLTVIGTLQLVKKGVERVQEFVG